MSDTPKSDVTAPVATTVTNPEIFETSGFSPWMRDNIYTATPAHIKALTVEDFKNLMIAIEKCRTEGAPFTYIGVSLSMPAKREDVKSASEAKSETNAPAPKLTRNEYKAVALCGVWKAMQAELPDLPRMSFKGEKEEFKTQNAPRRPNRAKADKKPAKAKSRPMRILTDGPFAALAALKK